jgi:hypothetical protein
MQFSKGSTPSLSPPHPAQAPYGAYYPPQQQQHQQYQQLPGGYPQQHQHHQYPQQPGSYYPQQHLLQYPQPQAYPGQYPAAQAPYPQPAMGVPVALPPPPPQMLLPAILCVRYDERECCQGRHDAFNIKVNGKPIGSVTQGEFREFQIPVGQLSVAAEERGLFGGDSLGSLFGSRQSHAGSVVLNTVPGQRHGVRLFWHRECCGRTRPLLVRD